MQCRIPRIVIAATQSGSGKTTLTAGLLAALRAQGVKAQPYKVGPDYIDTGYHGQAAGRPCHNLDSWLMSKEQLKEMFARTAEGADIAVIEGVMGLYDGGRSGVSSTAEIAKLLDAPVLLVIDAKSMGASAAALALGFRSYDSGVRLAGVLLNRLGSATHEQLVTDALAGISLPVYGAVHRDEKLRLPERHLGLLPAQENTQEGIIAALGAAIAAQVDIGRIRALAAEAPPLAVELPAAPFAAADEVRIAVARDEAFSFYYPESLQALERFGARIVPFSPLHDRVLPEADGLILGGGFPEMFAARLQRNASMRIAVESAAFFGMPIYAECGGFMYLMDKLQDFEGNEYLMGSVIPATARMTKKLQMVGYVTAAMQRDTVLGPEGTELRGHEFHFSAELPGSADYPRAFTIKRMRNGETYPAGYAAGNVLGSYLHIHFAGCPEAAAHFVQACRDYKNSRERKG